MSAHAFALFDTAIGPCGIAWSAAGIVGVQLPERHENATRDRLLRRYPDAREIPSPRHIQQAIDDIAGLLRGEKRDLSGIGLDLAGVPQFNRDVYAVARTIPAGATLSYGAVAARLGDRSAAREVGEAMGRNPFPLIVPCHRVLAAGGKRRRLLSGWRGHHQASSAQHRGCSGGRDADAVRQSAAGVAATTPIVPGCK